MPTTKLCLFYRHSTRSEGWLVLAVALVTMLALLGGLYFLDTVTQFDWLFKFMFIVIVMFGTAVAIGYAIINIVINAEFTCYLDSESFICISPVTAYSFALHLDEIKRIEIELDSDGQKNYRLIDQDERRYLLTFNYCNPDHEFIELLLELRPDLKERYNDS